uniref:Uncharacterized protein LOC111121954 n=1 Tax=Crassostrea virginica TaxID=6565 RepID=A0A8B8CTX9_CRAVI|nr:uncharacterized protein LOC111121954 [Crassostrea virginica]
MEDTQQICVADGADRKRDCFPAIKGRRLVWLSVVLGLIVVLALVISLPLALGRSDSTETTTESIEACPTGYTGQFCDQPECARMCHNGDCISPDTCKCALGWIGQQCQTAICETPCTDHGSCTSPGTCTCDVGWQGLTCEMPFSPGFQPRMLYIYNITLSFTMETDIEMRADGLKSHKGMESLNFLSNVNITFSVSSISRESNSSISVLKILNATCYSDLKNQTKNSTCDKESISSLLQIKVLFSQDLTTGKIINIYYNVSTEHEAVFVSRILRFIDCEIQPWSEKTETFSTVDGQQITNLRTLSKSPSGMQCFDFQRTVTSEDMATDQEKKKVCMGRTGAPESIVMSEVFSIGKDMKLANDSADDINLSPLPSFKGQVTAFGSLISMSATTNADVNEELIYIQNMLSNEHVKFSSINELAAKNIRAQKGYKESNVYQDIDAFLNHPFPNRRLSLGLELAEKSNSAISVIKKMVFTKFDLDRESRSLLIAILGASNTFSGQKSLIEILDAKETVEGDHYIVLGSIAQLSNITEDMVSVVKKIMDTTMNEDLKTRSCLVLGVLGSKGLQHKIVPLLAKKLLSKDVSHIERCAIISALGNTHSQTALEPLSKVFKGNETYYKILSIRALRNVPGRESYDFVLERLQNTRNKKEAMQCIKTLGYKERWISQNDLSKIINIARESKDRDFVNVVKNLLSELKQRCNKEHHSDYYDIQMIKLDQVLRQTRIGKPNTYEVKRESQNFGAYFQIMVDSQVRGSEFDFNSNINLDVKLFRKRVNLITAGSANTLIDANNFMSSAFMTLTLFGREYDLFMKSWKFRLGLGLTAGDPCRADNGIIRNTLSEYFKFGDFSFMYGISGLASVNLEVGLSGSVSFGYGFNAIGNDGDRLPGQINVVAKPHANITVSFRTEVSAAVIRAGVRGDIEAITGYVQTNVAFNLPNQTFCNIVNVSANLLSGSVFINGEIGLWFFTKKFDYKLFDWGGVSISSKLSESFCCPRTFLTHGKDDVKPIGIISPYLHYNNRVTDFLMLINATYRCVQVNNTSHCPAGLIQRLLQENVYVLNISSSKKLNADNNLFFQMRIFPIIITGFGQWYGVNNNGEVVAVDEIGQLTRVHWSVGNLLANLAYERKTTEFQRQNNIQKCIPSNRPSLFNIKVTNKVLDLRPYCSRLQAVCENIKMGKMYHNDVMIFTENSNIIDINSQEACSSYIRANGIRYPYYCEAYPFSFSLQGGKGATVIKANVMENNVKMAAVHAFIKEFNVKGGDAFVVVV